MNPVPVGASTTLHRIVADDDSAIALGSGSVPVLATPRLVAWLEAAAVATISAYLPEGSTSVGTLIELEHLAASSIGATIDVEAEVTAVDKRRIEFNVKASQAGRLVGRGSHIRFVVDTDRFLAGL